MADENNSIDQFFSETNKTTGEIVRLDVNATSTVQPVALMRLGLFVPTLKATSKRKVNKKNVTDATDELVQLSVAKSEGYTNIQITGHRLDMDTDFKVWLGIIRSMSEHGVIGDTLKMKFVDFVKMCGFDSRRSNKKIRDRIGNSLFKLASVTLKFGNETKFWTTHLVQSAMFDVNDDHVEIRAEPKLFELYQMDRRVLLRLKTIDALQRKESAQALYTFIESMPNDLRPLSMKRMRERLNLTSTVYTQNHVVRKAMAQLKDIGYLDYTEYLQGRSVYFQIHFRNPRLLTKNTKSKELPLDEKFDLPETPASTQYDDIVDALKSAGLDTDMLVAALMKKGKS